MNVQEYALEKKSELTALADTIRAKTGASEMLTVADMKSAVEGISGSDNFYDEFWDTFQKNGTETRYDFSFGGRGWTDKLFKPKYSMILSSGAYMFRECGAQIDLVERLKEQNVVLDTSAATSIIQAFYSARFTRVGVVDASNVTSRDGLGYLFYGATALKTIDKLILKGDGSQTLNKTFDSCRALANITIEGTVGADINFQSCPLTRASITSIVNALSTTASAQTLTLSASAVNTAFETSEGAADGSTSAEWATLIATKANWTVALI